MTTKKLLAQKKIRLGLAGITAGILLLSTGILLLSGCGVSGDELAAKERELAAREQEIAVLQARLATFQEVSERELTAREQELADLLSQLATLQQVSAGELTAREQELADLLSQLATLQQASERELATREEEIANLLSQLATLQPATNYWTQLTSVFKPARVYYLNYMLLHEDDGHCIDDHIEFRTADGLILGLHFDNDDISQAQNLDYVVIGVPGKFSQQDQERIEKQFGKGFTQFHDLETGTHGGAPGADGVWFMHIAVRELVKPWGTVMPGVDYNYEPTPPPDYP